MAEQNKGTEAAQAAATQKALDKVYNETIAKSNKANQQKDLNEIKQLIKQLTKELRTSFETIKKMQTQILDKLKELALKLDRLPKETLELFYNYDIEKTVIKYEDQMTAFLMRAENNGYTEAKEAYVSEFIKLCSEIEDSRIKLFSIEQDYSAIPRISQWYKMEIMALQSANKFSETIHTALGRYKEWFVKIKNDNSSNGLYVKLNELKTKQEILIEELVKFYGLIFTVSNYIEEYNIITVPWTDDDGKVYAMKEKKYSKMTMDFNFIKRDYKLISNLTQDEKNKIQELIDEKIIQSYETPLTILETDVPFENLISLDLLKGENFNSTNYIEKEEIGFVLYGNVIYNLCSRQLHKPSTLYPQLDLNRIAQIQNELIVNGNAILYFASLVSILENSLNNIDTLLETYKN